MPKIFIISTCPDDWGGSEELWFGSMKYFSPKDVHITVAKRYIPYDEKHFQELSQQGNVDFATLAISQNNKICITRKNKAISTFSELKLKSASLFYKDKNFPSRISFYIHLLLKQVQPDIVLLNQGSNYDGLELMEGCIRQHIPYLILSQKADENDCFTSARKTAFTRYYEHAEKAIFISFNNLSLTEKQLGLRLENVVKLNNPLTIRPEIQPFPSTAEGMHLLFIGRYDVKEKGQNVLMQILSSPKWINRPLFVDFYGAGKDKPYLEALREQWQLSHVRIHAFQQDVQPLYASHHALILTSHAEGLPLVLLEAMSQGRMCIATDVGGNSELIEDKMSGFLCQDNLLAIENMLELAWQSRSQWQQMGINAFHHFHKIYNEDPCRRLYEILLSHL